MAIFRVELTAKLPPGVPPKPYVTLSRNPVPSPTHHSTRGVASVQTGPIVEV